MTHDPDDPEGERPPADDPERDLMRRWAAGEARAGDILIQRFFPLIHAYFRRRAHENQEDLVQETFLRFAASAQRYRGTASVRIFVYGIARNVFFEYLDAQSKAARFDPMTSSLFEATGRRMSSMLAQREEHQLLLNALQDIPVVVQELIDLRYFRSLTGPELRDLFGIPEGTVRYRIRAALEQLAAAYVRRAGQQHELEVGELELERWLAELRSQDERSQDEPD
ncbi:RNA polymerase sigma factor [Nannocystaceae bacterium ST9]